MVPQLRLTVSPSVAGETDADVQSLTINNNRYAPGVVERHGAHCPSCTSHGAICKLSPASGLPNSDNVHRMRVMVSPPPPYHLPVSKQR